MAKDISAPHRNIGAVFRSGPHKGQPVYALARGLLRGETTAEQLPPLVVGKLAGDYWVLFGYRRLYALHLAVPHASVEVTPLLLLTEDMHIHFLFFPRFRNF